MTRYFIAGFFVTLISCNFQRAKSRKEKLQELAYFHYEHNEYVNAISYLDTLVNLDSANGEYFFRRAYSYGQTGNLERADSDYKRSIKLNFRVTSSYYNLALDAMQEENELLALNYFDRVLKADPSQIKDVSFLVKSCKERIEFKKTDAWKEFREYEKKHKESK